MWFPATVQENLGTIRRARAVTGKSGEKSVKTVKQLLDSKGYDIWSIDPSASVYEAIEVMAEKSVGALVVLEGERPVGIISERDYARKVVLKERSSTGTKVSEIMTTSIVYARLEQTVEECLSKMTEERIRHLPIQEGEKLVGMLSIGDLVKATIAEQQLLIEQLEHYISG
jgi:CBS domain-containing protein